MLKNIYERLSRFASTTILYLSYSRQKDLEEKYELKRELEDSDNVKVIRGLRRQLSTLTTEKKNLEEKLKNSTPVTNLEKLYQSKQIPRFYLPLEGVVMWQNEACKKLFTRAIEGRKREELEVALKVIEIDPNWDKIPIYNPKGEQIGTVYESEKYFVKNIRSLFRDVYSRVLNWKRKYLPEKKSSTQQDNP